MAWTTENLEQKVNEAKEHTSGVLDSLSTDHIKTEGFTVRSGNKLLKLQVIEETGIEDVEAEIREEFRKKLTDQSMKIKEKINEKLLELTNIVSVIKDEYEKKETEIKRKLDNSQVMPDVHLSHAEKGLSVVKGHRGDEYHWLIQGIYGPKFVDMKPIETRYAKKMITNVVFLITTKGDMVTSVSTRKPLGLGYFSHYHQNSPDCWGSWKYPKTWSKPDDIIKIAREAEAILENVYTNSVVTQSPRGLPRVSTLRKHIVEEGQKQEPLIVSQNDSRTGLTPNIRESEDMWMT